MERRGFYGKKEFYGKFNGRFYFKFLMQNYRNFWFVYLTKNSLLIKGIYFKIF